TSIGRGGGRLHKPPIEGDTRVKSRFPVEMNFRRSFPGSDIGLVPVRGRGAAHVVTPSVIVIIVFLDRHAVVASRKLRHVPRNTVVVEIGGLVGSIYERREHLEQVSKSIKPIASPPLYRAPGSFDCPKSDWDSGPHPQ